MEKILPLSCFPYCQWQKAGQRPRMRLNMCYRDCPCCCYLCSEYTLLRIPKGLQRSANGVCLFYLQVAGEKGETHDWILYEHHFIVQDHATIKGQRSISHAHLGVNMIWSAQKPPDYLCGKGTPPCPRLKHRLVEPESCAIWLARVTRSLGVVRGVLVFAAGFCL